MNYLLARIWLEKIAAERRLGITQRHPFAMLGLGAGAGALTTVFPVHLALEYIKSEDPEFYAELLKNVGGPKKILLTAGLLGGLGGLLTVTGLAGLRHMFFEK
jgi:hypothetical protein